MTYRFRTLFFILFLSVGCGESCDESDFDPDELNCTSNRQCDDGLYCNGIEICDPDDPLASRFGCVNRTPCGSATRYADGTIECRYPEQEARIAECFEDGGNTQTCCNQECRSDWECGDGQFCNGEEVCNFEGRCEAGPSPCRASDEECQEPERTCRILGCRARGSVDNDGDGICADVDCDDNNDQVSPGNPEICDEGGVDEDCDSTTLGPDVDGDGFQPLECCNGDECGGDCNDDLSGVNPGAREVCNGLDDNCNGDIDEGVRQTFYADTDGDGFGDTSATEVGCFDTIGSGYSLIAGDCDDTNPQIFPGSIVCQPGPNDPTAYIFCETDGTYSNGACDALTQDCVTQPGGHGVCTNP